MSYRDLIACEKSMDLAEEVHIFASELPKEEKFGLASQLKRYSVSVPSNIAEGYGRHSKLEFVRFLHIALGSVREMQTQLELCSRVKLGETQELQDRAEEVAKLVYSLAKSLKR